MSHPFQADGLPLLIGSLPVADHGEAVKLVFEHTPQIPLWVQLPVYREEGMIAQFLPGMPGLVREKEKDFIALDSPSLAGELLQFYEEYLAVDENKAVPETGRFALTPESARGFFVFMDHLKRLPEPPRAVKGQITGPLTFCTSVKDRQGKAIFYNEQLRDAAVKLLTLKAAWQVEKLSQFGCPVIIFLDEPALAGFGSSALISISTDEIKNCLEEVIRVVHARGGLCGIHVCSNTDWSLVLESSIDIVSFDAYSHFDKFILYRDQVRKFMESGGILAWGIIPTLRAADIEKETAATLTRQWQEKARKLTALGLDSSRVLAQSLITPSCGTGTLSLDHAKKVLKLTKLVSQRLRHDDNGQDHESLEERYDYS
ncbi:MAG: hypothetical protein Q8P24_17865 [Desulfobacterales bacterium]|nr:hypothetical protein [Desulfobacterales bacterium]